LTLGIFAEWLRRQGYTIIESESSYWYNQGPKVYQAFPYHWTIQPTKDEIKELLMKTRGVGLRYSTSIESPEGHISYHVVYHGNSLGLYSLPKKVRHDIQHGQEYSSIERISLNQLAEEGWYLRLDTLVRQGRVKAENYEVWKRLCLSAQDLKGFEAWGAVHERQLIASMLCFIMEDCCSILYQQSLTAHLKYGVNNALVFTVTNEMLCRPGIKQIFYGLNSLDAPASVDEFKFRMGYVARPVRQRVVFSPIIRPLFNSISHKVVKYMLNHHPENPFLAKTEGMIRFYLEGNKSLAQQTWPECLDKENMITNYG
jgi:hypothetical protein